MSHGYIRKKSIRNTALSRRVKAPQIKDDFQTVVFRTYRIPRSSLRTRKDTIINPIFQANNPEKYSYLNQDLVFCWKHPDRFEYLKKRKSEQRIKDEKYEEDYDLKTVEEALDYEDNDSRIFSCFNGIDIDQFVRSYNSSTNLMNTDVFAFDTSDELMDALYPVGMVLHDSLMLDTEDIDNIEDKRETVKITERGLVTFTNLANAGPYVDYETNRPHYHLKPGQFEDLPHQSEVEWYFPKFDQRSKNQNLHMLKKMATTAEDGSTEYHYKINPSWLNSFTKSQISQYRKDRRYGLLWRRYDPNRECKIKDCVALSQLCVDFFFYIMHVNQTQDQLNEILATLEEEYKGITEKFKKMVLILTANLEKHKRIFYPDDDMDITKHLKWKFEMNKKILGEYEKKRHILRKRVFGQVKRSANKNGGYGWIFLNFNSSH